MGCMTAVPLEESNARDSELRAAVELLRQGSEDVTVTDHGEPVAVLISPEELASLRETVDMLRIPGAVDAVDEGLRDADAGRVVDGPTALSDYLP